MGLCGNDEPFFFLSNPGAGLVYDLMLAEQAAGVGFGKGRGEAGGVWVEG